MIGIIVKSWKNTCHFYFRTCRRDNVGQVYINLQNDSDSIFRRTLLGYYAEGMHVNFKENWI